MGKALFVTEKPSVAMEFIKLLKVNGKKSDGRGAGVDFYMVCWTHGNNVLSRSL
jgi:DNA topoisomerase-3